MYTVLDLIIVLNFLKQKSDYSIEKVALIHAEWVPSLFVCFHLYLYFSNFIWNYYKLFKYQLITQP